MFQFHQSLFRAKMHRLAKRVPKLFSPISFQKRNAVMSFGWIINFMIISSTTLSYILYQRFIRNESNQTRRIRKQFLTPSTYTRPFLWCSRPDEISKFVNYFKTSPSGTLLVIGPDGSGKSAILKQAISDSSNRMVYLLDLRKYSITTEDEFMYQFVESSGYLLPNTELFARWLLREQVSKTRRIAKIEVDKSLASIQEVLLSEKNHGWRNGIPIICIIGMESVTVSKESTNNSADEYESNMTKFLNFCTYVSDNRLCHVVLVTTWAFAHHVLDRNSAWFMRRELVDINFANHVVIENYLKEVINPFLKMEGRSLLDENDIKYISKNIGANITDINTLITDLMRGDSVIEAVDRMVLDSVKKVTFMLESIINEAHLADDPDKKSKILERYVRFCEMMKLFTQLNAVSRAHMIRSIFLEQPSELDYYEQQQIVCYWQKKPENIAVTDDIKNRVKISSLVVIPGSPRLLVAFELILHDTRMKEQQIKNEWTLRIKQLNDKKKRLIEDSNRLQGLKRDYAMEYWRIVELSDRIKASIGDEEYEKLKLTTTTQLAKYGEKLQKTDSLISDIDKFITEQ